jgi:alkylated DNA repair dioxygenase AlkB
LEVRPIKCGGVAGPIAILPSNANRWELVHRDEHRRSFISCCKQPFDRRVLDDWMVLLSRNIAWNRPLVGARRLPRSAAWLTYGECECTYKYGGTSWPALAMEPWFLEITDAVCHACGLKERPNSCNANFYEDGTQMVGWHSDDEPLFNATRQDSLILSLSLGATRTFEFRPDDDLDDVKVLILEDGDICTMEGLFQKHYKHKVPPEHRVTGPRINLTWRWVVSHDSDCPLHSKRCPPSEPSGEALHSMTKKSTSVMVGHQASRDISGKPEILLRPSEEVLSPEELAKREKRRLRFEQSDNAVAKKNIVTASKSSDQFPVLEGTVSSSTPSAADETRKRRAERFGLSSEPASKVAKVAVDAAVAASAPALSSVSGEASERRRKRLEKFGDNENRTEKAVEVAATPASAPASQNTSDAELRMRKRLEKFSNSKSPKTELKHNGADDKKVSAPTSQADRRQQRMERFVNPQVGSVQLAGSGAKSVASSGASVQLAEVAKDVRGTISSCTTDHSKIHELSELDKRALRAQRFK